MDVLNISFLFTRVKLIKKEILDIYYNEHEIDLFKIATFISGKPELKITTSKQLRYIEVFCLHIAYANKTIGVQAQKSTVHNYYSVCNSFKAYFKDTLQVKDIPLNELKLKHLLEYEDYYFSVSKHKQVTINKSDNF